MPLGIRLLAGTQPLLSPPTSSQPGYYRGQAAGLNNPDPLRTSRCLNKQDDLAGGQTGDYEVLYSLGFGVCEGQSPTYPSANHPGQRYQQFFRERTIAQQITDIRANLFLRSVYLVSKTSETSRTQVPHTFLCRSHDTVALVGHAQRHHPGGREKKSYDTIKAGQCKFGPHNPSHT